LRDGKLVNLPPVQYFHVQMPPVLQAMSDASYPNVLMWADSLYVLSVEKVSADQLGIELGAVTRQVHPMPLTDGDANSALVGSHFFAINGHDQYDVIAVERDGELVKAFRHEIYR
jgi:hypothetical protein